MLDTPARASCLDGIGCVNSLYRVSQDEKCRMNEVLDLLTCRHCFPYSHYLLCFLIRTLIQLSFITKLSLIKMLGAKT